MGAAAVLQIFKDDYISYQLLSIAAVTYLLIRYGVFALFNSVNLANARIKKSFGTALKLFSYKNITASALLTICTLALYWITPSPRPLVKVWNAILLFNQVFNYWPAMG